MDSDLAEVSVSHDESGCVLLLRGSSGLELASKLHGAALEVMPGARNVTVDLSKIAHLDGCVLQVLLAFRSALEKASASLGLKGVTADFHKYLEYAGVGSLFDRSEQGSAANVGPG